MGRWYWRQTSRPIQAVRLTDFMPWSTERRDVVRVVEGLSGRVRMHMELVIRFDYGSIVPWVRRSHGALSATAGPDTLELHTPVQTRGQQMKSIADFEVGVGERIPFVLNYRPSHLPEQEPIDALEALARTEQRWREWSQRCSYKGRWHEPVLRSLLTLKALIYEPTGGIVAAPTNSLPEQAGGVRNWDYRYCWLRDATFTLNALLHAGYTEEALAWQDWLLRAVAGRPADMQILYSVTGERRLDETELSWLPGYGNAAPVRIGNAAATQFQLDVYGEVMDTLHLARAAGYTPQPHAWRIQRTLLTFLETHWREPDEGIWEVRGPRRHFTHSKVMAWVAFDRGIKAVERYALDGRLDAWRRIRDEIHAQVCEAGFDTQRNSFVQHYGSTELDASLLLIPLVGVISVSVQRVAVGGRGLPVGLGSPNVAAGPRRRANSVRCLRWRARRDVSDRSDAIPTEIDSPLCADCGVTPNSKRYSLHGNRDHPNTKSSSSVGPRRPALSEFWLPETRTPWFVVSAWPPESTRAASSGT